MLDKAQWQELYKDLSEPFPASDVYFRVGQVTKKKDKCQALIYAEPRSYEDRLNTVCPGNWGVTFIPWSDGRVICNLTIFGVTRASTGEENEGFAPGTAAEAQSFKRACVKFGLGRYMYDIAIPWVPYDETTRRMRETPPLPRNAQPTKGYRLRVFPLSEISQASTAPPRAVEKAQASSTKSSPPPASNPLASPGKRKAITATSEAFLEEIRGSRGYPGEPPSESEVRKAEAIFKMLEISEDGYIKVAMTIAKDATLTSLLQLRKDQLVNMVGRAVASKVSQAEKEIEDSQ